MEATRVEAREEIGAKLERVRGYLDQRGLAGILVRRRDNFAWLTAGGDNHVVSGSEVGVIALLITANGQYALTNRIEAGRAQDEELSGLGYDLRSYPWYESAAPNAAVRDIVGDGSVAADVPGFSTTLDAEFDALRYSLLPPEIERYRALGQIVSEAMVAACHTIRPGMTEHEIGSHLASLLLAQGVDPSVLLVATDERVARYRHPIPTNKKLDRYAMLVTGALKWGLSVSITRFVSFGDMSSDLQERWRAVNQIAAYFTLATRPGREYADIFAGATRLYNRLGYPDEWQLHHQGGPTGYRGREFTATFETTSPVVENQAVAWNPSITGTKSEDTIVVTSAGHEFLTRAGAWPLMSVEHDGQTVQFADVLIR
jgi:Xaa-Pro dipeptidase